ncbi:MAG: hypothetical protein ISS25_02625 [Nanoarchaeota archaeon]|nr:hypothetical protein [DPANN group archaeon]MBL7116698.1 hypothetical protein [Nanoarchaeota archaeon]
MKRFKANPEYFKEVLKKDAKLVEIVWRTIAKVRNSNLQKLSKEELFKLYQKMWYAYRDSISVSHIVEGISYVAEPLFKKKLEQITELDRHDKKFKETFNVLMQPKKPSFISKEHIDLLKIMTTIAEDKNLLSLFQKESLKNIIQKLSASIRKKISAHKEEYYYNQLNYYHGESLTDTNYVKEIQKLLKSNIYIRQRIKEEEIRYENNNEKRNKLIKELHIDEDTKKLLDLIIEVLHWQDDRKKHMLCSVYHMNLILKEISKKFTIPLEMLKCYFPFELTFSKLESFDKKDGEERMKHFIVYMKREEDDMKFEVYTGKEYKEFMDVYYRNFVLESDIHGTCASQGSALGTVKVCKTRDDLDKVDKGDVLVASMTRPEFVPAMKKASAIVTDEGGITCHAAIVARELNKPCVIGTKIATKALKDGDLVEVKANHGIVKKIK